MLFSTLLLSALGVSVVRTEADSASGLSADPYRWWSTENVSPDQIGALQDIPSKLFQRLSAEKKRAIIWAKVSHNATSGPFSSVAGVGGLQFFRTNYLLQTQDTASEEMPINHKKYIHPVGRVGKSKFEWNAAAKKYSGLFQQADQCLVRFSSAAKPYPLLPGAGIKCFREGADSGNFVAMWQLDGLTDELEEPLGVPKEGSDSEPARKETCKFFSVPFSNHVAFRKNLPQKIKIPAHLTFARVAKEPGFRFHRFVEDGAAGIVGLSSFASVEQGGSQPHESEVNFPFALVFAPTASVQGLPCQKTENALGQVAQIGPGDALYQVYAVHNPVPVEQLERSDVVHIGTLTAESAFVTSAYGDERLFVRHDFYGKDVAAMQKADAARGEKFRKIWEDNHFLSEEGAIKYMPFLSSEAADPDDDDTME